jgi:hypothetical protein
MPEAYSNSGRYAVCSGFDRHGCNPNFLPGPEHVKGQRYEALELVKFAITNTSKSEEGLSGIQRQGLADFHDTEQARKRLG